eukprot:scaffold28365_cov40-Cyclotella_meneghiniana.AAC.2
MAHGDTNSHYTNLDHSQCLPPLHHTQECVTTKLRMWVAETLSGLEGGLSPNSRRACQDQGVAGFFKACVKNGRLDFFPERYGLSRMSKSTRLMNGRS